MPKAIANHRHSETHYWTQHCPPDRQDPAPSMGTHAQVPPTRKPLQSTDPTPPVGVQSPQLGGIMTFQLAERRPQT